MMPLIGCPYLLCIIYSSSGAYTTSSLPNLQAVYIPEANSQETREQLIYFLYLFMAFCASLDFCDVKENRVGNLTFKTR